MQRALGKISVKHPRLKGKRVPVDPGLAVALSEHADRTSDRTLAWAARQITSLRFKEPERAAEIAKGFGQLLDWSDVALVLDSANKAQKINLLGMKISDAWEWQDFYHRLLASIVDGKVAIPSGWTQFQTGAALGISPGALRQMNSRHLSSLKAGDAIRVSEPGPLQQRLVLTKYPDGHAWVWVKPGPDKDSVGRNIGLCVANNASWNRKLQFALVDPQNRPHALLTMNPVALVRRSKPIKENSLLRVRYTPGTDRKLGTVRLNVGRLLKDQILLQWGEIKGRFNQRPVPDPYRRYAVALMTSGLLGPVQIAGSQSRIAAADLSSLLLVGLPVRKALPLWKKAGGHQTVFSLANGLETDVHGDGGPGELTSVYFGASEEVEWLNSALAPLYLAALSNSRLMEIWDIPGLPKKTQSELLRQINRRKDTQPIFWERAIPLAKSRGVAVEPHAVTSLRARAAQSHSTTSSLRDAAVNRLVRKRLGGLGSAAGGLNVFDLALTAIDRGHPLMMDPKFVSSMMKPTRNLDVNGVLAIVLDRYKLMYRDGGGVRALNEKMTALYAAKGQAFRPYNKGMTLRYLAFVAEALAMASMDVGSLPLTPEEIRDDMGGDHQYHGDEFRISDLFSSYDEGWHCANCFNMDEETAGIACAIWDMGQVWSFYHTDAASSILGQQLGIEQPIDALEQCEFMFDNDDLPGMMDANPYLTGPLLAEVEQWGDLKVVDLSPSIQDMLARFKARADKMAEIKTVGWYDVLQVGVDAAFKSNKPTKLQLIYQLEKIAESMINPLFREAKMQQDFKLPKGPTFNRAGSPRR